MANKGTIDEQLDKLTQVKELIDLDLLQVVRDYQKLVENLKLILNNYNITYDQVGAKLGLSKSTVSRRFDRPNLWKFEELEQILTMIEKKNKEQK